MKFFKFVAAVVVGFLVGAGGDFLGAVVDTTINGEKFSLVARAATDVCSALASGLVAGLIATGTEIAAGVVLALLALALPILGGTDAPPAGAPPWYPTVSNIALLLLVPLGAHLAKMRRTSKQKAAQSAASKS